MPGYVIDVSAQLLCQHGGQAKPTQPVSRVKISGQAVMTQTVTYAVTACGLTGSPNPPCATAQWMVAALRVKSSGQALLLKDSQAQCAPTGTPLTIVMTQLRVKAI